MLVGPIKRFWGGMDIWVGGLIIVALVVSCGPSLRRTAQSNNAFARCFEMDYTPGVDISQKGNCWNTWIEKWVYNQASDKKNYALLRQREIAQGISIPGPPGPPGRFDERPMLKDQKNENQLSSTASAVHQVDNSDIDGGDSGLGSSVEDCAVVCSGSYSACQKVAAEKNDPKLTSTCKIAFKKCTSACLP